jgi:hypothetical protein
MKRSLPYLKRQHSWGSRSHVETGPETDQITIDTARLRHD